MQNCLWRGCRWTSFCFCCLVVHFGKVFIVYYYLVYFFFISTTKLYYTVFLIHHISYCSYNKDQEHLKWVNKTNPSILGWILSWAGYLTSLLDENYWLLLSAGTFGFSSRLVLSASPLGWCSRLLLTTGGGYLQVAPMPKSERV